MKREKVIELAKKASFCGSLNHEGHGMMQIVTPAMLSEFARLVEQETRERVNRQLELSQEAINQVSTDAWGDGWICGSEDALNGMLVYIRNLKDNHDKK